MDIRNEKLDNIKGFLILLVVFGHFLIDYHSYLASFLLKIIYLFHMPFFAFISGFFSKKNSKVFYIIYIYLIINSFYMLFSYFTEGNLLNFINPYYSMWYLLSLASWRLINKLLKREFSNKSLIISILIALIIGFFPKINNTLAISRTICFFPFFIYGNLYKKNNSNNKQLHKNIIFIFFIIISTILISFNIININMLLMYPYYSIYDILLRIIIFITAISFINLFIKITPTNKIKLITRFGNNTLSIYLFHRIIPIIIMSICFNYTNNNLYIPLFIIISLLICITFSSKLFNKIIEILIKMSDNIKNIFYESPSYSFKNGNILLLFLSVNIVLLPIYVVSIHISNQSNEIKLYKKISYKNEEKINDSIKISFIGDLILLKKQIEYNKINNIPNYNYIFDDAKEVFNNSDYSIGILEGPVAGKELSYTNSNFDDNVKKLLFNFPIEFAESIKNSGIDLVNISNNHLLDKGIIGVENTISNLNKLDIDYTGAYLSKDEKEEKRIKCVNIKGLKVAILSYTYGINYHTEKNLLNKYDYLSSYLVDPESLYFNKIKNQVENDFRLAKKNSPDLIIVMPHMGTQFSQKQDYYQNIWNKIFVDNGAKIIFGDHSHRVQPLEYIGDTLIINSPGNFINSYLKYDGDLGSVITVYIDKKSSKIITSSIIPTIVENKDGCYKTKIINNYHNSKLEKKTLNKLDKSNKIITKTMINEEISFNNSLDKYFFFKDGFKRLKNIIVDENNINKNGTIYKKISESKSITFIGDSITEGSKNGGYGYYEPIINYFNKIGKEKKVCNISKCGATTTTINEILKNKKCNTELYVIAIGTNNIRYKNEKIKNPSQYIESLNTIISKLGSNNIIIISPFISNDNDIFFTDVNKKKELYNDYDKVLSNYCRTKDYLYVNINNYIYDMMQSNNNYKYMLDYIHPNNNLGIKFYSEKILSK